MEDAVESRGPVMQGPLGKTAAVEIQALNGIFAPARSRQPTDSPPAAGLPDDSDSSPCLARAAAPQVCDTAASIPFGFRVLPPARARGVAPGAPTLAGGRASRPTAGGAPRERRRPQPARAALQSASVDGGVDWRQPPGPARAMGPRPAAAFRPAVRAPGPGRSAAAAGRGEPAPGGRHEPAGRQSPGAPERRSSGAPELRAPLRAGWDPGPGVAHHV